jgi:ribonucleotide reductase class II
MIGNLIGNGSLDQGSSKSPTGLLRYWGEHQKEMAEHALTCIKSSGCDRSLTAYRPSQGDFLQVGTTFLGGLCERFGVTRKAKSMTDAIERSSYDFHRGLLQGLFDADGSVQGNLSKGGSVRLSQSTLSTLTRAQRMLARLGIQSKIYENRREEGERLLPGSDRSPTLYHCKANHELVIANDNLFTYQDVVGFRSPDKRGKLERLLSGYKRTQNRERFVATIKEIIEDGVEEVFDCTVPGAHQFDGNGFVAHNCGEIIGKDFHCNLSEVHLNRVHPHNLEEQLDSFKACALYAAAALKRGFIHPRHQLARDLDPIVAVTFTGSFDFFVTLFGADWLKWWENGRDRTWGEEVANPLHKLFPDSPSGFATQGDYFHTMEAFYLNMWREVVEETVAEYCDKHNLKAPNRSTAIQPSGSKSLLTGASPGWHPPKSLRYIRRITFDAGSPIARACMDAGYRVVPGQFDTDDDGQLLNNPFDPRCHTWLIEIPCEVSWANMPGVDSVDIGNLPALAQFDFYMQHQRHYTRHNTSGTLELSESEIPAVAQRIYEAIRDDEGYVSMAMMSRSTANLTFPRLPFEPISEDRYQVECDRITLSARTPLQRALNQYAGTWGDAEGPSGCDSMGCEIRKG